MASASEFDMAEFARALLDPDAPPPKGLVAPGGVATRRFAVYRNNVVVGLIEALEQRFPVCLRLVGDEFFRAMAGVYVRRCPPRSPILAEYGDDFASFVAGFEPARDLPYLPDVARLEYAIGRAYHAADAAPLPLEVIQSIPGDVLGDLSVSLHPSLQLAPSQYPIVSIWRTNTFDAQAQGVELGCAEDALVVRPRLDVEAYLLPAGGHAFLQALVADETLSAATDAGQRATPDFDLTACFRILLSSGAIIAVGDDAP